MRGLCGLVEGGDGCVVVEVKKRHKVDILNCCLLTDHQKLWRSVEKVLVSEGCSENWHHDEVQPATMRNIYHLLSLQSRAEQSRPTTSCQLMHTRIRARGFFSQC